MYSTIVLTCCKFESVVIIHVMGIGITYIKACCVAPRKEENLRTVVESILLFFFYGNVMFDLSVLCRHSFFLSVSSCLFYLTCKINGHLYSELIWNNLCKKQRLQISASKKQIKFKAIDSSFIYFIKRKLKLHIRQHGYCFIHKS